MIFTKVFKEQVLDRMERINNCLKELSPNFYLMPVLKNNANGMSIAEFMKIFKEYNRKHRKNPLTDFLATSYLDETNEIKSAGIQTLSWIWNNDSFVYRNDLINVRSKENIYLGCKNYTQLRYCYEKNFNPVIWFDLHMNRGGFKMEEVEEVLQKVNDSHDGEKKISIAAHCPYSDKDKIKEYLDDFAVLVGKIKDEIRKNGYNIRIHFVSYGNSAVFRNIVKDPLILPIELLELEELTYFRLGEVLMLPDDTFQNYIYRPFTVYTKSLEEFLYDGEGSDNIGYQHGKLYKGTKYGILPFGYYHFNDIKYVYKCDNIDTAKSIRSSYKRVESQMNDMSIINLGNDDDDKSPYYHILCYETMHLNAQKSVQKTFTYNKHMVNYKTI